VVLATKDRLRPSTAGVLVQATVHPSSFNELVHSKLVIAAILLRRTGNTCSDAGCLSSLSGL